MNKVSESWLYTVQYPTSTGVIPKNAAACGGYEKARISAQSTINMIPHKLFKKYLISVKVPVHFMEKN